MGDAGCVRRRALALPAEPGRRRAPSSRQIPWLRVFVQGVVIVGKLENYPCPRRSLALEFHQGQDAHAFSFQALAAAEVG